MLLKLLSFCGLAVFLFLAWLGSSRRDRFPWRIVLWGLGLQFGFAVVILKTRVGLAVFDLAQRATLKLNDFAGEGAKLVFGPLADSHTLTRAFGASHGLIFAIPVASVIIFMSALSSLLYHWGVLQKVVQGVAWLMRRVMGTSGSETLATAANIFVGQTTAPLLIKPYLPGLTRSELLALMSGGMATIAGSVLVVYVSLGAKAGDLLTASVMSAPAALVVSKILLPETELSPTRSGAMGDLAPTTTNSIDALCRGAGEGLTMSLNVLAMLIAFVAVVAMANFLLSWVARPFGLHLSLERLFGWANAPFAWLMGIPAKDCLTVGQILGQRVVLNEFFGYLSLTQATALDPRSVRLATYALCGFANFGSVAVQIGGIGALVPERRGELAQLGLRSMWAGLLACYLTTTVVGILL